MQRPLFKFAIITFLLCWIYPKAQTPMDTLKLKLKSAKNDKEKCEVYNEMSIFIINEDPDLAQKDAIEALKLAKISGYKDGEGFAYYNLGNVGYYLDEYEMGLKYLDSAEAVFNLTQNKKGFGFVYNTKGEIEILEGKYSDALGNLAKSLKFFEEIGDNFGIARVQINIGSIHYYQKNYQEAIKYFKEAIKRADETRIGDACVFLGYVYVDQENYAEAKGYVERADEIGTKNKDNYIISDCQYLLGRIDFFYGDIKSAEKRFLTSLEIQEELENYQGITIDCNYLGKLYLSKTEIEKSIQYYRKAYEQARDKGIKEEEKIACLGLSNAFNYRKLYDSAYYYLKLNNEISEELLGEEASKKLAELEASLQAQKKAAEVEAERKVRALRNTLIIVAGAAIILVFIIISFVLFKRNKLKQKRNQELAAINREIEHQRDIIEEKHKEITDSINYAERIQRSMLATKNILDKNLNGQDNYFIFFKPKDVVSGDFYWASELSDGNFAMVTADSTGHGVPGSIMSMLNMNSLKEAVKEKYTSPADILNYTRNIIINTLKNDGSEEGGKDGMDCCCVVFDFKHRKLKLALANNPVWVVRAGEVIEFKPDKMPVGKHDRQDVPFTQQELDLQSGDVVYALTDGFPDQFGGEKGKKFMSKNLREFLVSHSSLSMKEQCDLLETTFVNWVGDLEQVDDVSIVGVRIA